MNSGYYSDYGYYGYDSGAATSLLGGLAAFGAIISLISLAVSVLMLVSMWKVFTKCGKPGWAALIPIYNMYTLCEIAEKPWWYLLLFLVPFANIYAMFVLYDGVAKKFGKSTGFTIGMMLLPFVFWPMLAFSKDSFVDMGVTESIDGSESISDLQPQANTYGIMEEQPNINTMEQTYQAPAFNTMVQEPAMPANNFVQEPVMPANNFVQEPAQPANNFVQEPAQPVNNFVQEPAMPANNFVQDATENNLNEKPTSMWSNNINNNQM